MLGWHFAIVWPGLNDFVSPSCAANWTSRQSYFVAVILAESAKIWQVFETGTHTYLTPLIYTVLNFSNKIDCCELLCLLIKVTSMSLNCKQCLISCLRSQIVLVQVQEYTTVYSNMFNICKIMTLPNDLTHLQYRKSNIKSCSWKKEIMQYSVIILPDDLLILDIFFAVLVN